jgi:hypothetical protein
MKRALWRVMCGILGLVLLLIAAGSIETCTADRRYEAFLRQTGPIYEGMTEAAVMAVAGAPDTFVTDISSATDRNAVGAHCRETNGTAAILYIFEYCGWMCEHLDLMSAGSDTKVVCLDDRRIVVNTYSEMLQY